MSTVQSDYLPSAVNWLFSLSLTNCKFNNMRYALHIVLKVVVDKAIIPIYLWQECNAHDINGVLWDLMKETPPVFFWWGRIRIWQLEAMFNSKPEQFEYFFSASNGILYSFSDLKPSGFFDLPNIAGGNNFHQINRRNLLILPGGPPGLEGNGKPLSDTRFLSLLFLFILPP